MCPSSVLGVFPNDRIEFSAKVSFCFISRVGSLPRYEVVCDGYKTVVNVHSFGSIWFYENAGNCKSNSRPRTRAKKL